MSGSNSSGSRIAPRPSPGLGPYLERLRERYDERYLATDPIERVHRYSDPEDREVIGLVAAVLAFGGVKQIQRSLDDLRERMGPKPSRFVDRFAPRRDGRRLEGWRHRWIGEGEIVRLLIALRAMRKTGGSLSGYLRRLDPGDTAPGRVRTLLSRWSHEALDSDTGPGGAEASPYFFFLFPHPERGSACKRLCLYLRWMARPDDGIDFGLFDWLSPAHLVLPLDTHLARVARRLELTRRRSADFIAAEEATATLARYYPDDPLRYDFALCRLGILAQCPKRVSTIHCASCSLLPVCRHGLRSR